MMRTLIFLILLSCPCSLFSAPTSVVPEPVACLRDLEMDFFAADLVTEALSFYLIPQGLWNPITLDLQSRSRTVPERMKQRTRRMVPNPIEYPINKEVTARILKVILFEVFMETMNAYQVNEQPTASLVFDYIFSRRLPDLARCLGAEVEELAPKFD